MQITDLSELKKYWPITEDLSLHRNVANLVYFSKIESQEIVIRLTPTSQRSSDEINAELQWMNDLKKNGLNIVEIILSNQSSLFHTLNIHGSEFHIMVMKKIEGTRADPDTLTIDILHQWSATLALLHKNSKSIQSGLKRETWNKDTIFLKSLSCIDSVGTQTKKLFQDAIQFVSSQTTGNNFGLIHGDLHTGNYFIHNNQIIVFDFDDCCYHYFLYDLTIPVLSIYKMWDLADNISHKQDLINQFLENYFSYFEKPQNFKNIFKKFIQYRLLLVHYWLIAIRSERELSEDSQKAFADAIKDDLYLAENLQLFDFIQ